MLAFGFAALLFNAALSSKDSEIGNLNSRIGNLEADKAELTKKLASAPKARTDEEQAALNQIAKDRDDVQRQLDSSKKEVGELRDQLNKTTGTQSSVKSPILGLDDAERYQLIKGLRDATANGANGRETCHAMVQEKPSERWAAQIWPELQDILNYSGWWVEGGRTSKSYFPAGITLSTTKDAGDGFNCAFRLSEMFLGLKLPTTLRDNQVSPDLNVCEKENPTHGCVEIIMGGQAASP